MKTALPKAPEGTRHGAGVGRTFFDNVITPVVHAAAYRGQPELLVSKVKDAIDIHGYVHVRGGATYEEFLNIADGLGSVFLTADVKVTNAPNRTTLDSNIGLVFHTDSCRAHIVGWYCVTPGRPGEATLLLDVRDLTEQLSEEVCEALSRIPQYLPGPNRQPDTPEPILSFIDGQLRVNFCAWMLAQPRDEAQQNALQTFLRYIETKARKPNGIVPVQLAQGEILFINNHHLLHGRRVLAEDTPRHLKRVWISNDPRQKELWARSATPAY